jgi:hypothetical protein
LTAVASLQSQGFVWQHNIEKGTWHSWKRRNSRGKRNLPLCCVQTFVGRGFKFRHRTSVICEELFHGNCHEAGRVQLLRLSVALARGSARPPSAHSQLVGPVSITQTCCGNERVYCSTAREKPFIEGANCLFRNVASACCMSKLLKCMTWRFHPIEYRGCFQIQTKPL